MKPPAARSTAPYSRPSSRCCPSSQYGPSGAVSPRTTGPCPSEAVTTNLYSPTLMFASASCVQNIILSFIHTSTVINSRGVQFISPGDALVDDEQNFLRCDTSFLPGHVSRFTAFCVILLPAHRLAGLFLGIIPPGSTSRRNSVICKRVGHRAIGLFVCALIVRYLSVLYLGYYHVR